MTSMLRRITTGILPLALVVLVLVHGTALRADTFLGVLDDVPLMPGLTEDADAGVAFETATGRIVTARATGRPHPGFDIGAVLSFYGATLPALGWRAETRTRFRRDGEVLTLQVARAGTRLELRFDLRPEAAAAAPSGP